MPIHPFTTWPRRLLRAALALGLATCAGLALADDDQEREQLARISSELARVQAMVSDAAQAAPTGQRVKFRYDWLQRDLEMMRQAIDQHVDAPRQPRAVAPLRGDYRQ